MTADELDHQRLQEKRALAERTAETGVKMQKERAAQDAARLRRLQADEDYQWFMATYFEPIHEKNHAQALNLALSPVERNDFAQRYDLSKTIKELPGKREGELRSAAGLGE